MAFTIRRAVPGDLEAVGRVTVRAYLDEGHLPPHSPYAATLDDARSRAEQAELWVAVDDADGRVLGSVTFAAPGSAFHEIAASDEGDVRMLAVAGSARGRGIGEALMVRCVERARELGLSALALSTQPSMRAAHRVYERLGFERVPERDWTPAPGITLLAYRLDLRQPTGS
ncbi:GNAT family N-acetyltransferase [Intrasporangium sp. DVR]|uniref:GNAT family N-acetyltransferase n=1 Tax=Intrasporangium sp. DVR TaxID=3127867 RepID=UPI00313A536C